LPAPVELGELSQSSALSAFAASAASLPPFFFTSAELRTPVDGFARTTGSWVAGVFERMTTVYLDGAETEIPASRNAGLPFRFTSRLSDQTTSAEVSGVPSAKWTFFFSWKVYVFASELALNDETRSGTGCARSSPLYVNSVSYSPWSISDAVGSKARPGSDVLIVNELSMTSVGAAVRAAVPTATSAAAATTAAASGASSAAGRGRNLVTAVAPLSGTVGLSGVRSHLTSGPATSPP